MQIQQTMPEFKDSSCLSSMKKTTGSTALRPVLVLVGLSVLLFLLLASLGDRDRPTLSSIGFLGGSNKPTSSASVPNDRLLNGLLSSEFDEESCLSRYQARLYRKASSHILSSYLISKLRNYESLHKKCSPNTPLYLKSIEQLKANHSSDQLECNYIIWSPADGIGNRMLSLTSTFLYALLTNRVMLVLQTFDMSDLLCEPFPRSTWYLPSDFPLKGLEGLHPEANNSYGYMAAHKLINDDPKAPTTSLPPFVFLYLKNDYIYHDLHKRFFCENDQYVIDKVNWVLLHTNQYILPGLFLLPQYEEELARMFPLKETTFHHLGRYLLHPSNSVWGIIMQYNNSYLVKSNERIGIQARIFGFAPISEDDMYKQIVACATQELILPNMNPTEKYSRVLENAASQSVLLVSLYKEIYEKLKGYYMNSTSTGKTISVYQPSHEEWQQFNNPLHNQKAVAEIWLLSFSDVLVTTAVSTLGYVSYGLAGIKPWHLRYSRDKTIPDPPCRRALTIDGCLHVPPNFDCKTRGNADAGKIVRHVKRCDDYEDGVKLFD